MRLHARNSDLRPHASASNQQADAAHRLQKNPVIAVSDE
jgi:hypothetical protein